MKSRLLCLVLTLAVIGATVFLIRYFKDHDFTETDPATSENTEETAVTDEGAITKAFVEQCGYDLESAVLKLAYGEGKSDLNTLADLADRFERSAEYLRTNQDPIGASYCAILASTLHDVLSAPFADNASFAQRTANVLRSLDNAYPVNRSELLPRLPKLDTSVNGDLTLALFSVYQFQKQDQAESVVLTFGGNLVTGDTLLSAESETGFKARSEKCGYAYPLYALSSVLTNDDSSFANLKVPFTQTVGVGTGGEVKGAPAYAALLKSGGIEAVSVSDPEVLSFGEDGKRSTKEALTAAGVSYCDEGTVCYVHTKLGDVAYLTYDVTDELVSDRSTVFSETPKNDIAAAKAHGARFVIVHFNWNVSTAPTDPNDAQAGTCTAAVKNGADLIFSTHPGNLSAVQQLVSPDVPGAYVTVVYSAGDLFDLSGSDRSFLLQQNFSLNDDGAAVPGPLTLIPLVRGEDGAPRMDFSAEAKDAILKDLVKFSAPMKGGLDKANANFKNEALNMIVIEK